MFEQLFVARQALARHRTSPLAEERFGFLTQLGEAGLPRVSLRYIAEMLLRVIEVLHLADRSGEIISRDEIRRKATDKQHKFVSVAVRWLRFLHRLQEDPEPTDPYAEQIRVFAAYLREERGLSSLTVTNSCRFVRRFLGRLRAPIDSHQEVTITAVDKALLEVIHESDYARRSIQNAVSELRGFLRYAEKRGWCRKGLAEAIQGPRVFTQLSLPVGPFWDDVRRLLAMTEGDRPVDVRDRAILMLFAIYGLRRGEVGRLRLC